MRKDLAEGAKGELEEGRVEAVTVDMNGAYRSAAQEGLQGAEIVADKFHVFKRVNEQLDKLRLRLQVGQGRKGSLYKGRYLLLKNREELNAEQRGRLGGLLKEHPYFEFGLTNAFTEGKNTRTKQIQRQAYGYRNLDNSNLRILLPCA